MRWELQPCVELIKNAPIRVSSSALHYTFLELTVTNVTPYTHYLSTLKVQIVHYIGEFYLRNAVLTGCQL